ncbi:hypothetical protein CAPTEDRAFT_197369 [Capitella teleta]|uniref:Uncharacterized protein n=1 Tax=Capitella teleta TaxID=283909 RepID=R7TXI8_CAPTE|nr:hypothetical protein CAPTEDRAFT_197369 [Capitella teleta]|eukprot:ELT95690.1 hypothetical protein CAPTEDRAFT_197369 [Capitella teleta]
MLLEIFTSDLLRRVFNSMTSLTSEQLSLKGRESCEREFQWKAFCVNLNARVFEITNTRKGGVQSRPRSGCTSAPIAALPGRNHGDRFDRLRSLTGFGLRRNVLSEGIDRSFDEFSHVDRGNYSEKTGGIGLIRSHLITLIVSDKSLNTFEMISRQTNDFLTADNSGQELLKILRIDTHLDISTIILTRMVLCRRRLFDIDLFAGLDPSPLFAADGDFGLFLSSSVNDVEWGDEVEESSEEGQGEEREDSSEDDDEDCDEEEESEDGDEDESDDEEESHSDDDDDNNEEDEEERRGRGGKRKWEESGEAEKVHGRGKRRRMEVVREDTLNTPDTPIPASEVDPWMSTYREDSSACSSEGVGDGVWGVAGNFAPLEDDEAGGSNPWVTSLEDGDMAWINSLSTYGEMNTSYDDVIGYGELVSVR